jgi:hypothetical protein
LTGSNDLRRIKKALLQQKNGPNVRKGPLAATRGLNG